MPGSKKIRIFAGPNGSGKSTLFKEFASKYNTGFFVNADELEKVLATTGFIDLESLGLTASQTDLETFKLLPSSLSLFAKAESEGHQIKVIVENNQITDGSADSHSYEGSFIAAFIRDLMIAQNKSFSFETVMSHESKVAEIKSLVKQGYKAYLYFVCIDDPEVNISRIKNRVALGGHNVDSDKVQDRYYRTLNFLHEVMPLCYRAYLFDNSGKRLNMIAEGFKDELILRSKTFPGWFMEYVYPHYTT